MQETDLIMAWYLIVFVISCSFTHVSGCTCVPFDPEIDFCDGKSGFAAVFRIDGNGTVINGYELVYDVDILYKYTFNAPSGNVESEKLYTNIEESMCGIRLRPDSYYVITGYFRGTPGEPTKMKTSFCNTQEYFKEYPIVNGNPPPCEKTIPGWQHLQ